MLFVTNRNPILHAPYACTHTVWYVHCRAHAVHAEQFRLTRY